MWLCDKRIVNVNYEVVIGDTWVVTGSNYSCITVNSTYVSLLILFSVITNVLPITTWESKLTTLLSKSHKFHLGQIEDYILFVQVGIGDPILSDSNATVIFLSFSHLKMPFIKVNAQH